MTKFPNLFQRVLVSVIAIPIILLLVYLGKFYFAFFVAAIILLSLFEFYKLTELKGAKPDYISGFIYSLLVIVIFFIKKFRLFSATYFSFRGFCFDDEFDPRRK